MTSTLFLYMMYSAHNQQSQYFSFKIPKILFQVLCCLSTFNSWLKMSMHPHSRDRSSAISKQRIKKFLNVQTISSHNMTTAAYNGTICNYFLTYVLFSRLLFPFLFRDCIKLSSSFRIRIREVGGIRKIDRKILFDFLNRFKLHAAQFNTKTSGIKRN